MTQNPPGVFDLANQSLTAAFSAFRAMPLLFGSCLIISAAASIILKGLAVSGDSWNFFYITFTIVPVEAALFAISGVATHRFVILSEVSGLAVLAARGRLITEFFLVALALNFGAAILALMSFGLKSGETTWWLYMPVVIAAAILVFKIFLIFPAIAVDAPGRSIARAFHESRGLVLRGLIAGLIPAVGVAVATSIIVLLVGGRSAPQPLVQLLGSLSDLLLGTVVFVIASKLYMWRVRNPLNAPAP